MQENKGIHKHKTNIIPSLPTIQEERGKKREKGLENVEEKEKDEDMDFISLITMEYLMNKQQYERYKSGVLGEKAIHRHKKDKKFYKKRIVEIVRDLCKVEETQTQPQYNNDILFAFEHFSKTCIQYFKQIDKRDILQEEYDNIALDIALDNCPIDPYDHLKTDTIMMQPMKRVTLLDTFVKRIVKKKPTFVVPQQRHVHLTDPLLKNKGIGKKKNINHIYEAENQDSKI